MLEGTFGLHHFPGRVGVQVGEVAVGFNSYV